MNKASKWILSAVILGVGWASEACGDATEWGDEDDGEFGGGGALKFDAERDANAGESGALEWGDNEDVIPGERGQPMESGAPLPAARSTLGEPVWGGEVGAAGRNSYPGEILSPSGNGVSGSNAAVRGYAGTGTAPADADVQDRQSAEAEAAAAESPDVPDRFEPFRRVAPSGEDIWELPGLREILPKSKDTAENTAEDGD